MIGRRFAHYVIVDALAAGGMGVVYRARDEHLDRDVAVKLLPPESSGRMEARRRFRREALTLSRLHHPHIAVVHDFSEQDGLSFLVMELIEGESLHARIARGALTETEVRRLGAQIASALDAAHRAGVVHRDLKPANVMIDPDGNAKVLDFGLAHLAAPAQVPELSTTLSAPLTEAGVAVGTLPYMAPEQLLGLPVDGRTDIHALGVVLHEMATGRLPWRETLSTALVNEITHVTPPGVAETTAGVSAGLDGIVARCLQKRPEDRFASAHDVCDALLGQLHGAAGPAGSSSAAPAPGRGSWWPRAAAWMTRRRAPRAVGVAAIAVVLLAVAGSFVLRERLLGAKAASSLAVLPLENLSGDPEEDYFVDGITDELINRLTQIAALRVTARPSVMRYEGPDRDLPAIGRELGVRTLVTGSVLRQGQRVRISVQLTRADRGENLWAEGFEGSTADVVALQGRIARAIAERVGARLTEHERSGLTRTGSVDPRAHEAYLRGRYYLERIFGPESGRALDFFNEAIRLDPGYAPAYAALAEAYVTMSNVYMPSTQALPRAKAAALQAIERDSTLAEAWAALAYVRSFHEWKWEEGGATYARALELNPGRAATHRDYGIYLIVRGRFEEAGAQIEQAWALDPLSALNNTVRLFPLYENRRFDEAIAAARDILLADSSLINVRMILGQSLLMNGEREEALEELTRAAARDGQANPVLIAWLGYALARNGRADEARDLLHGLENAPAHQYVSPVAPAILCAALGDRDGALRWLERAVEQRYEDVCLVHLDAGFDPLRGDPRFDAVLAPLGLVADRRPPG